MHFFFIFLLKNTQKLNYQHDHTSLQNILTSNWFILKAPSGWKKNNKNMVNVHFSETCLLKSECNNDRANLSTVLNSGYVFSAIGFIKNNTVTVGYVS